MAVTLRTNVTIIPALVASSPLEPSVAMTGSDAFYTAWDLFYLSNDGGKTFTQPASGAASAVFPEGFKVDYGDQSAIWSPNQARVVWAMIFKPADGSSPRIRIAYTSAAKLRNSAGRDWTYFDITTDQIGQNGRSFDYPQLSLSQGFLYVTAISADLAVKVAIGAVVFRFDVAQFETLGPGVVNFEYFAEDGIFSFGAAQRCDLRAFWAGHVNNTTTRIYWWDDFVNRIGVQDVTMPGWIGPGPFQSLTPDGSNWLSFESSRITGACVQRNSSVVFGWTAGNNENHPRTKQNRPHPYIYLAQFNQNPGAADVSLGGVRDIWHPDFAWAVPTLGTNSAGRLAMTCAFGGGSRIVGRWPLSPFPQTVGGRFVGTTVGFVDLPISQTSRYDNVTTAAGTAGAPRWGDFISLRNHDLNDDLFLATGYTVHDNPDGDARGVLRFVIFGDSES